MPDASLFHSISDSVGKKLGELVMLAIWAGAGLAGKFVYDLWQQWRKARQQAKQSSPVYLAEKQIRLNITADRACRWAGAAHVSIYQFSNGQFFSNGDSIQKVSMVAEATENNAMARWLNASQNLPTAGFPNMLTALSEAPGRTWLYRDECKDYELNRYMRERGYTSRVVLLLTGNKCGWLGLLVLSFSEGRFTDEVLPSLQTLEEFRREAASILSQS